MQLVLFATPFKVLLLFNIPIAQLGMDVKIDRRTNLGAKMFFM
jgi:hypothetical protein